MKRKILLGSIICLFLDILSKYLIDRFFVVMESKTIINKFLFITKIYNDGASWNILSGNTIILIIITIIFLLFLLIYQKRFKINKRNIISFSMIYGGIIGNLLNRIIYGYVIDFIDIKLGHYNFPVFNLADIFIVLGVLLLLYSIYKKDDENEFNSR